MVGFLWTISLLGPVALITGANAQVTAPSCDASLDYTWVMMMFLPFLEHELNIFIGL